MAKTYIFKSTDDLIAFIKSSVIGLFFYITFSLVIPVIPSILDNPISMFFSNPFEMFVIFILLYLVIRSLFLLWNLNYRELRFEPELRQIIVSERLTNHLFIKQVRTLRPEEIKDIEMKFVKSNLPYRSGYHPYPALAVILHLVNNSEYVVKLPISRLPNQAHSAAKILSVKEAAQALNITLIDSTSMSN